MKQTILITLGTILILAVCGVWVYLLIFGTPESAQDLFTNFDSDEQAREFIPNGTATNEATVAVSDQTLEQLTTRPVAGFAFVEATTATDTPRVIYAERGTGHVYTIDLTTGTEERVLGKTFTTITEAAFAPDGSAVVLTSQDGYEQTAYLEEITTSTSTPVMHEFVAEARNVAFIQPNEVRFTHVRDDQLVGSSYNIDNRTVTERFSLPFTDARVLWLGNRTLVYNKPAPLYSGGLYQIDGNTLTRIGTTGYALSALAHPQATQYAITSADTEADTLTSSVYTDSDTTHAMPIVMLPEKCAFNPVDANTLWCAAPAEIPARTYQADWYKGIIQSQDLLWRVTASEQRADVIVDPLRFTGRAVDVTGLTTDAAGEHLLFKNKIDNTLWLFRVPKVEEEEDTTTATSTSAE